MQLVTHALKFGFITIFFDSMPTVDGLETCSSWKNLQNDKINGGFDSRRHPIYIESAILNSKLNVSQMEQMPNSGATYVFKLAESILPLIKHKINKVLRSIE